VHAELVLVEGRVLVLLPHLQVVDFFHHWLPETHPGVDEPVRHLLIEFSNLQLEYIYKINIL
jgi:hypothetical protein